MTEQTHESSHECQLYSTPRFTAIKCPTTKHMVTNMSARSMPARSMLSTCISDANMFLLATHYALEQHSTRSPECYLRLTSIASSEMRLLIISYYYYIKTRACNASQRRDFTWELKGGITFYSLVCFSSLESNRRTVSLPFENAQVANPY